MVNDEKREIWERFERETRKAYDAFCKYREMGKGRSYAKIEEKFGLNRCSVERWGKTWKWVERVDQWDRHMDKILEKRLRDDAIDMRERHTKQAMAMQSKVINRLNTLNEAELTVPDLLKMFDVSVKVERLSRGESTENVNQNVQGGLTLEYDVEIARRIVEDPEASKLASALLARVAYSRNDKPSGASAIDVGRVLATGEAPGTNQ